MDATIGTSTLSDFRDEYGEMSLKFSNFFTKSREDVKEGKPLILLNSSILDKYREVLNSIIIDKELGIQEINDYRYNPWRLSYDLYGTIELWSLLLEINHMYSVREFDKKKIKVFNGSIISILNNILAREEKLLNDIEDSIEEIEYRTTDTDIPDPE